MTPQQLAILLQAIQALGIGRPHMAAPRPHLGLGMGDPHMAAISRPARVHDTQLSHPSPILAPRTPLQAQTRGPSLGGRQTRADSQGRAAQPKGFTRIETPPSAASSAYMSLARRVPAPGITSHDINWSNMTKGKGAGNFGM